MTYGRTVLSALLLAACAPLDQPADPLDAGDDVDARSERVDVCHVDEETGDWHPVRIAAVAVDRHLDNHGDWLVEDEDYCWDGIDDDCNGEIDDGCNGCDLTVTRDAGFWETADCAISGDTGVDPFPIMIGTSVEYDNAADVLAFLASPGSDNISRLERQLIALHLNIAFFGIGSHDAYDVDGDGVSETFSDLVDYGNAIYDSGPSADRGTAATNIRTATRLGSDLDLWFDDTCEDVAFCGGEDDDAVCGCVEVCGDDVDNNEDGDIDEDCD